MRIGRKGAIGLLVAAGLLAVAFAVPAFAETEATDGPVGFVGGICRGVGSMASSVAGLFGMTTDELNDARVAGESLSDIAADQGVEEDALIDLLLQRRSQMLERAVANERITQEEADQILAQTKERLAERIDDPTVGPAGECGSPGGGGEGCGPAGGSAGGGPAMGQGQGRGNGNGEGLGAGSIGADGEVGGPLGTGCAPTGGPKTDAPIEPSVNESPMVDKSTI